MFRRAPQKIGTGRALKCSLRAGAILVAFLLLLSSPLAAAPGTEGECSNTIVMGGDVGLGRYVEVKARQYDDWLYPFREVAPLFQRADIAYVNFEEPLTERRIPCNNCMRLGSHPDSVAALTFAGIDVVSLANNHQGDFGPEGVLDNIRHLDEARILHAGAGADLEAAHAAALLEVGGIRFGFLSYNEVPPYDYAAAEGRPGIAWLDAERLKADIARHRDQVDVLFVLPHWGVEYTNVPTGYQVEMAHLAIDSGADIVVGNHPHWVQRVEMYKGRPIFYALGNLVFDQMWSVETRQAMVLELSFDGPALAKAKVHPVLIHDYCQPRLVEAEDPTYQAVLRRAGLSSDEMAFQPVPSIRNWLAAGHRAPVEAGLWPPEWHRYRQLRSCIPR